MIKDPTAHKLLRTRIDRVISAPEGVWSVGDLTPLIRELGGYLASLEAEPAAERVSLPAGDAVGDLLQPVPPERALPILIDRTTPTEVLSLFREFVIKNASQWRMGAGDHHHPMWSLVSGHLEDESASYQGGPYYQFLQPENRKSLQDLIEESGA